MSGPGSVFLDFNLPNKTTWFYFSLLLAVALFFKFSRVLSMRNWDVLTLFLLVPGLLLLQEARSRPAPTDSASNNASTADGTASPAPAQPSRLMWFGYLWLLSGSAYFLVRCLVDLALVRRPALTPNLNFSGLAWLGGALFVCLVAVAFRPPAHREQLGKGSPALDEAQRRAADKVSREAGLGDEARPEVRFWVERGLAVLCHLAVVAALVFIGWRHFQDLHAGTAAATFYLLLPYTAYHVSQVHHVWPMAFLLWAVAAYRLPALAGLFLGLAAGTFYFPALTVPVWLSFYWRRGFGRFAVCFLVAVGLSLAATCLLSPLDLPDWQPWKVPAGDSFWTGVHWAYRIPVFVAYLAFVATTAFWPSPKNLAHVLALSAAVLIGVQFWYADEGGVYVLWYLPLLLLLVFRPNLSDRQPVAIQAETDWLVRLRRTFSRAAVWLVRQPEGLARVR
jgi:hypothetical protein